MKAAIAAAIVVALMCGSLVYADLEKGAWAPDLEAKEWYNSDEPVSLNQLRGMTVVLFFWVSFHEGGEQVIPLMNLLNSRLGRTRGVYIIGVTDGDRTRVEAMLKKQKVFFPVALEAKKTIDEYKITSFPHTVVIDPSGKVAWAGWPGGQGEDELAKLTLGLLADNPPIKTHPLEAKIAEEKLREARQALRDGDYREAFVAAITADEHALAGDELKIRCQDMLDLVEAVGRDRLAQAERAAVDRRFEDAVTLLADLRRDFRGMDVARAASRKLEALKKKYPEVARHLEKENELSKAEALLAKALDDLRASPRRIGPAFEKLEEIVGDYAGTATAAKAQTVLDRIKKNDGMMDYVRDHKASKDCEAWLSQARVHENTRQYAKARELYQRILKEYFDTIYADQAAQRLAQLP
jgi:peroxiredoxin